MSKRAYHPDRGDVIMLNYNPAAGREIDKRRPAIVLSSIEYNRRTGLCLTVPISSDTTPGPLWIDMPAGILPKPSLILCDFVKNLDYRERSAEFVAKLSPAMVDEIVAVVLDLIDPMK